VTEHYDIIFDIADRPFNWWPIGLALPLLLLALLTQSLPPNRPSARSLALVPVVIGALWIAWWGGVHWTQHQRLLAARSTGQYEITEGSVENFYNPPIGDHGPDTFSVNSQRFEVHSWIVSEAFNSRTHDGGPRLHEACVRILHTDRNEIIWLGVSQQTPCPSDLADAAE